MKTKHVLKTTTLFILLIFTSCEDKVSDGIFAEIQTNKGTMILKLNYKSTPLTVANFITLAEGTNPKVSDSLKGKKYYEGIIFHRVIKDFMIQGGDRTGTGMGGPGYTFKDEFVDSLRHNKKGTLSMANSGPATNGSQFFITLKETPHLDGRHTVFGHLVKGEAVLDSIGSTLTSKESTTRDRPIDDIIIQEINILKGGEGKKFKAEKYFSEYFEKKDKLRKETLATFESQKQTAEVFKSGIKVLTIEEGTGEKPNQGDNIEVNYSGFLADSGKLFASSWYEVAKKYGIANENAKNQGAYRPMPSQYSSEVGLIAGFREALLTMSIGQKIRVFIPSKLGYGNRGSGPIPPNSDLVFDIELVGVTGK